MIEFKRIFNQQIHVHIFTKECIIEVLKAIHSQFFRTNSLLNQAFDDVIGDVVVMTLDRLSQARFVIVERRDVVLLEEMDQLSVVRVDRVDPKRWRKINIVHSQVLENLDRSKETRIFN